MAKKIVFLLWNCPTAQNQFVKLLEGELPHEALSPNSTYKRFKKTRKVMKERKNNSWLDELILGCQEDARNRD